MSRPDTESADCVAMTLLAAHFQERADDRIALFQAGWDGGAHEETYRHCYRTDLFRLLYSAAANALRSIIASSAVTESMSGDATPEEVYRVATQTDRLSELAELVESRSAGKTRVLKASLQKMLGTADEVSVALAAAGPVDLTAEFESHCFGEKAGGEAATAKTLGSDDWLEKFHKTVAEVRNKAVIISNKHPFTGPLGDTNDPEVAKLRSRMETFDQTVALLK